MKKNEKLIEAKESSTSKIHNSLRLGGPPAKKPILGPPIRIYSGNERFKIDEEGYSYLGISIKESIQIQNEKNEKNKSQPTYESTSEEDDLKKLDELAHQRYSSHFFDEGRDVFCHTRYQKNEDPSDSGCQLHWVWPESLQQIPYHPFEDKAYVFLESSNQLFYGKKCNFEEIKINDLVKFKEHFKTIMHNQYKYYYKHITYEELNKLITLNTGHSPDGNNFIELPNTTTRINKKRI